MFRFPLHSRFILLLMEYGNLVENDLFFDYSFVYYYHYYPFLCTIKI